MGLAHYLTGLGLGLLPLLVANLSFSASSRLTAGASARGILTGFAFAGVLWLATIIAMVVLMTRRRLRYIGYGLLSIIVLLPVLGATAWLLVLVAASRGR